MGQTDFIADHNLPIPYLNCTFGTLRIEYLKTVLTLSYND